MIVIIISVTMIEFLFGSIIIIMINKFLAIIVIGELFAITMIGWL